MTELLAALGGLRFALVILVLLFAGVLVAYRDDQYTTMALVVPLGLFAINLSAAIVSQPLFRRQAPLLIFHVSLLAIVALIAIGRMTYLNGAAGVVEGEEFSGNLMLSESGPWHFGNLADVRFTNEGFEIDYKEGLRREQTRNQVSYTDESGQRQVVIVGDQTSLVMNGYRFYTTFNKGYAPTFLWIPSQGEPTLGAVHLPSYPLNEYEQASTWTPPGSGREIWVQLQFDEVIIDPGRPSKFRVPRKHKVVLRIDDHRAELTDGQRIELEDGVLIYQGVRTWMGYQVFYDFTIPWLLAACVTAVASLGWYFYRKFQGKPWHTDDRRQQA